ncbi:4-hydroxy-3-methylbut-2-enyl diphosphate reductase [Desulfofustis limnaeus]|uniref:4-hydroxy-3-methylbut-2-enyl diphosphate reductase n=1 Tax=Desulfofustis limnaeus TaxID=2740163 RepID=UPI00338FB450
MDVVLASPRGFCAGVVRAIETVKLTLQVQGAPVYVLHEIVHNRHVIAELEQLGARFVKNLGDIPQGASCIFSAHGVSAETERKAAALGLQTIDATCPIVTGIHRLVEKYYGQGYDVVIIGHHGHPEVVGTAGRVERRVHVVASEEEARELVVADPDRVAYVTQTTLSQYDVAAIRSILVQRFPGIKGPAQSNICYATQNRQDAVRQLAERADVIFVVGSKNSSNSNRLQEVASGAGSRSYLIDDRDDLQADWLIGAQTVGITAGASAPERLVEGVLDWLGEQAIIISVSEFFGKDEHISFKPAKPYQ